MKRTVLIYCLLAFLISWLAKFIFCAEDLGWIVTVVPTGVLQLIASYGPSLAGLIVYNLEFRRKGWIAVMHSLTRVNVRMRWYLLALFFELASFILIVLFANLTGYGDTSFISDEISNSILMFFVNTFTLTLLTGLGEEIGWRGFLLPKLQSRFPVITAALILAFINSLWHLRTDLLSLLMKGDIHGFIIGYFPDMGLRILISLPIVFIMVYLFNKTGGSLFIMILYHGSANASWEWVKQVTRIPDPSYLLPLWTVFLWLTAILFVPALLRQARNKELITCIFQPKQTSTPDQ